MSGFLRVPKAIQKIESELTNKVKFDKDVELSCMTRIYCALFTANYQINPLDKIQYHIDTIKNAHSILKAIEEKVGG